MIFDNINALCSKRKMTISALEKAAGLGNGTIRSWRTCSPTIDKLQTVAKVLGVKVSKLLE